jgi:hypothetical protein
MQLARVRLEPGTGLSAEVRAAVEKSPILPRARAQGLIEYGLIIALVAVLAIAGLIIFGPALSSLATRLGGGSG